MQFKSLHFLSVVDNNQGPFYDFKTLGCCDAPFFDLLLRSVWGASREQSRNKVGSQPAKFEKSFVGFPTKTRIRKVRLRVITVWRKKFKDTYQVWESVNCCVDTGNVIASSV